MLFRLLPDGTRINENDLVGIGDAEAIYDREGNKATFVYRLKFPLALHDMLR